MFPHAYVVTSFTIISVTLWLRESLCPGARTCFSLEGRSVLRTLDRLFHAHPLVQTCSVDRSGVPALNLPENQIGVATRLPNVAERGVRLHGWRVNDDITNSEEPFR